MWHGWVGKWCEAILHGCVSNALRARLMCLHIAASVSCQNTGARDRLMKAGWRSKSKEWRGNEGKLTVAVRQGRLAIIYRYIVVYFSTLNICVKAYTSWASLLKITSHISNTQQKPPFCCYISICFQWMQMNNLHRRWFIMYESLFS